MSKAKCKEANCDNPVDIFYYCDDHFKGEGVDDDGAAIYYCDDQILERLANE